jgi:uncharacterized protein YciI
VKLTVIAVTLLLVSSLFPAPNAGEETGKIAEPEFEMTTYYMGLIYRGEKWTPEVTDETMKIQKAHRANMGRLARNCELILAGPFGDDTDLRGIFIFAVDSLEKAEELVQTDPAVKAGRLRVELHPWYAVKGITYPNQQVCNNP